MDNINEILLNAIEQMKKNRFLRLEKECKGEYIIITFLCDDTKVYKKLKTHYTKDKTTLRKQKKYTLSVSYLGIIANDVYDLVVNHKYKIIEEKDEKNGE